MAARCIVMNYFISYYFPKAQSTLSYYCTIKKKKKIKHSKIIKLNDCYKSKPAPITVLCSININNCLFLLLYQLHKETGQHHVQMTLNHIVVR